MEAVTAFGCDIDMYFEANSAGKLVSIYMNESLIREKVFRPLSNNIPILVGLIFIDPHLQMVGIY